MVNSRWGAQIIDNARHHDADNPHKKIDVNKPRFKGRLDGNHKRFHQGKHHKEENAGEHVSDKFCHTLKIHQSNTIDVNSLKKQLHFSSNYYLFLLYKPLKIGPHYEH